MPEQGSGAAWTTSLTFPPAQSEKLIHTDLILTAAAVLLKTNYLSVLREAWYTSWSRESMKKVTATCLYAQRITDCCMGCLNQKHKLRSSESCYNTHKNSPEISTQNLHSPQQLRILLQEHTRKAILIPKALPIPWKVWYTCWITVLTYTEILQSPLLTGRACEHLMKWIFQEDDM